METIPELKRRLNDAKLRNEYYEGKQEANRLKKEIFKLKHRNLINIGNRTKKAAKSVGKTINYMGREVGKNTASHARAIHENQVRHGGFYGNLKFKGNSVKKSKLKIKYYKKKGKRLVPVYAKKKNKVQRNSYNPLNPFNLDF